MGRLFRWFMCRFVWHDYEMTMHGRIIGPCRRCGFVWTLENGRRCGWPEGDDHG